jgi:ATP-dependent helicase HrpB
MDDDTLTATLDQWLPAWLGGMKRWRDLDKLEMVNVLKSLIDPALLPRLDELAPARLDLPDGRRMRLDYRTENPPTLAIKLQAMFGCRQTPTVAGGRVPVQLHLLSPAGRPLAVTADLASFWANAYPQVRKDMRGRYPKHDWPESP